MQQRGQGIICKQDAVHTPCNPTHTEPNDPYLSLWWTNLAGVSARAEGGKKNVLELPPPRAPVLKAQTSGGVMDEGELQGAPRSHLGHHCAFQMAGGRLGSKAGRDEAVTEQEKRRRRQSVPWRDPGCKRHALWSNTQSAQTLIGMGWGL